MYEKTLSTSSKMSKGASQRLKISDYLTNEELRALAKTDDLRALISLIINWSLVGFAFAVAIIWPNPITVLLGVLILAGRQLGLAILTHDCAHHAFFSSRAMNNSIGHWLCGMPLNVSLYEYRDYHLKHHRYAGTDRDPDRGFVAKYPVTKASLRRKITRDLTGQTGVRDLLYVLKKFNVAKSYPWLIFHILLLAILTFVGASWAYLMWWFAALFVFPLLMRIRQIGEHGVASDRDSIDPRENTSTTLASWWERLMVAPNYVNYHLEHHQCPGVPGYNLPRLHELLISRGYHDGHDSIAAGYIDVLKRAAQ